MIGKTISHYNLLEQLEEGCGVSLPIIREGLGGCIKRQYTRKVEDY